MVEVKTVDELQKIINESGVVLLKVSASWCGPCKLVKEYVNEIEKERGDVTFVDVDVDECDEELVDELGVRGVPMIKVYKEGKETSSTVGLQTKSQLLERL